MYCAIAIWLHWRWDVLVFATLCSWIGWPKVCRNYTKKEEETIVLENLSFKFFRCRGFLGSWMVIVLAIGVLGSFVFGTYLPYWVYPITFIWTPILYLWSMVMLPSSPHHHLIRNDYAVRKLRIILVLHDWKLDVVNIERRKVVYILSSR